MEQSSPQVRAAATVDIAVGSAADPYERERQIFPRLTNDQLDRIANYGVHETPQKGTYLFRRGERSVDFFVCLSGAIEILDRAAEGDAVVTTHGPQMFTGELDLFNNRKILVDGRVGEGTSIIRVPRGDFHRMISAEPDIGEVVMRAFILRRTAFLVHDQAGITLAGPANGGDTLRILRFLGRNGYPLNLIDTNDTAQAEAFSARHGTTIEDLPVVVHADGTRLSNPTNHQIANVLGLTEEFDPDQVFDVAVIGAGPAGLAAATYAASEGLNTAVIEQEAPGGQAGTSSKIENYLGFPTGISGQALAGRAWIQAQKFGARFAVSRAVTGLRCDKPPYTIELECGETLRTRTIVVASGARYRKLNLANYERYEGQGIHYAATAIEARVCENKPVIVVGGGNSAGQAAMFLSRSASHVHMLVRNRSLAASMSDYLIRRLESSPKVTLHYSNEIVGLHGEPFLSEVTWRDRELGEESIHAIGNIFVMIGAVPNSDWLVGCLELDARGFVVTGVVQAGEHEQGASQFATNRPGIYAVGDVRSGSVKRVASGVGEGSVVVSAIHQYLAAMEDVVSEVADAS